MPTPARAPKALRIVARGQRLAEARLLSDLAQTLRGRAAGGRALAEPILLVVSSQAQRRHLSVRVARELGPAVLNFSIQTFQAVARDILSRANAPVRVSEGAFEVAARRACGAQGILQGELGLFGDFSVAAESVRDFLSAGLAPAHVPLLERAALEIAGAPRRERALALVRAAQATLGALAAGNLVRPEGTLGLAAKILEQRGAQALPAAHVFVHGFADATGLAASFLKALLASSGGRLYLCDPSGRAALSGADWPRSYLGEFETHFADLGREEDPAPPQAPALSFFHACGSDAEVREAAHRIAALLRQGTDPGEIGVAVRRLTPSYAAALRRRFGELGIALGGAAAPAGFSPRHRRWRALANLLELGMRAPADHLLDAAPPEALALREDLRLALRAEGAARLEDVAALQAQEICRGRDFYALPVRRAAEEILGPPEAPAEGGKHSRRRRTLPLGALAGFLGRAKEAAALLAQWPADASGRAHAGRLRRILTNALGWAEGEAREFPASEPSDPLFDAELSREEYFFLLRAHALSQGEAPLGGEGAGVRVLDVTTARALTFEHLFVLGMNRGTFPRSVAEDPLLPDDARRPLRAVLGALPLKRAGFGEERYLFEQLLSAAPRVTLSWQRSDDEGKPLSPSAFLEQIWTANPAWKKEAQAVPRERERALLYRAPGEPPRPLLPREALELGGLAGSRREWGGLLPLACRELGEELPKEAREGFPEARDLAAARLNILDEFSPSLRESRGRAREKLPGPYLGFVGPALPGDPRQEDLYVTTLERFARCPWQTFVLQVLGAEPVPDPLSAFPGLDAALRGTAVHEAWRRLLEEKLGTGGTEPGGARAVPAPSAKDALRAAAGAARQTADALGVRSPGFHQALARQVVPFLERSLVLGWDFSAVGVYYLGSELRLQIVVRGRGGEKHALWFRADQAHTKDGVLVLRDLKTGQSGLLGKIAGAAKPETRQKWLRAGIRSGELLQAPAYASYEGPAGPRGVRGEYGLLGEGAWSPGEPFPGVAASDPLVRVDFQETAGELISGWKEGVFFPRLSGPEGKEPPACEYCPVAEACLRGDSGARRRLENVAGADAPAPGGPPGPLEQLRRLWWLGAVPDKKENPAP